MPLDGKQLGKELYNGLGMGQDDSIPKEAKKDAMERMQKMGDIIINHILDNLDIKVPRGKVITGVTGGSGAPAIGIKNPTKINCDVK